MTSIVFSKLQPFRLEGNCTKECSPPYCLLYEAEYHFMAGAIKITGAHLLFEAFRPASADVVDRDIRPFLYKRRPPEKILHCIAEYDPGVQLKVTNKDVLYSLKLTEDGEVERDSVLHLKLMIKCPNEASPDLDGASCSLGLLLDYESSVNVGTQYGVEFVNFPGSKDALERQVAGDQDRAALGVPAEDLEQELRPPR